VTTLLSINVVKESSSENSFLVLSLNDAGTAIVKLS